MSSKMSMDKSDDGMVVEIRAVKTSNKQQYAPVPDYLDEYDQYGLDNEKYFLGGQGGKQRTKKDIAQNVKYDPCGNVRKITSNLMNFEHNRRK